MKQGIKELKFTFKGYQLIPAPERYESAHTMEYSHSSLHKEVSLFSEDFFLILSSDMRSHTGHSMKLH